jgi:1,4-alpha-glucan branching enzyme
MPYVRKNGVWPVGEDWLYQVMSETYIPLLGMLAQLEGEGIGPCLALTLTPVLCEQLADEYIQERFVAYLRTMQEHAGSDLNDFVYFKDDARKALAEAHREEFKRKLMAFVAIGGDLIAAFASFEAQGMVETLASCATHAFLPAQDDPGAVRDQVLLGIESHRKHLGVQPKGFWLPECAYREGIEEVLASEGVEYFIVDSSSQGGLPAGRPYLAGGSGVVALARSDRAHANAWDKVTGYPTDALYIDSTKYYQGSGLHYWRVTGLGVSIEAKEVYEPTPATVRALDHAGHYIRSITSEVDAVISASDRGGGGEGATPWNDPPLVVASYDTEFLGHGWKEGIYWLELTLRSLAAGETVRLTLPSAFITESSERQRVDLLETTWGTDRDHSTWVNPETAWMWDYLGTAQERLRQMLARFHEVGAATLEARALRQAVREVLLLESSDWPYMVAKDRARDYAIERFRTHLERFEMLAEALESTGVEGIETALGEIEEADNIFAGLDLGVVSGHRGLEGPEGR